MMTLTLQLNGKTLREYHFEGDKAVTIGRGTDNDVVINNLGVSGHHARIENVNGGGYLFADLKSKNGSFVNERAVTTWSLTSGDRIIIGKHTLLFSLEGQVPAAPPPVEMEQTMVIDTEQYRARLAGKGVDRATATAPEPQGVLCMLVGGEGDVPLTKKLIRIGKSENADVRVSGWLVGATAATISRRASGFHLGYTGGFAKPRVNGNKVKGSVRLKEFDIIEIGSVKMQLTIRK